LQAEHGTGVAIAEQQDEVVFGGGQPPPKARRNERRELAEPPSEKCPKNAEEPANERGHAMPRSGARIARALGRIEPRERERQSRVDAWQLPPGAFPGDDSTDPR
jgi:hypothetical protein